MKKISMIFLYFSILAFVPVATVEADDLGDNLENPLSTARIRVTVFDTPGGDRVGGAVVNITNPEVYSDCEGCGTTTDENGEVTLTLTGVPSSSPATIITVEASGVPGYSPKSETTGVVASATVDLEIVLSPSPDIDIEKLTNGVDADDPNAGDAPQIMPGELVTWTYRVTNTGEVTLQNLEVVDNQTGVMPICPIDILEPGEMMVCTASAPAENLDFTSSTTVPGRCGDVPQRPLYENMGRATGQTDAGEYVEDVDPSHYCNPQDEDEDGIPDDQDECPDTVIPEFVPTKKLGTNRFALVDGDTTFDTKAPKGKGPRKAFTVEDTAGCSCEQIIEEMGLGKGHKKFGCSISAMEEWIDAVNAAPVLCDNIRHINKLTLVWDGTGVIHVTTELGQEINGITPGDVIVLDTEGAGNDLWITISGAIVGESTFHLSCSDEDMNGPEDCGKVQGNGKTSNPSLINDWLFAGMEGENGILECSP